MPSSTLKHPNGTCPNVLVGPPGILFGSVLVILLFARLAFSTELWVATADGAAPVEEVREVMHHIEVVIHDQVAASRKSFQIYNAADKPVEITVDLALLPQEVIDGFCYWNGDEKIVGEVLEKQTAAQVYSQLTGIQRDPGLLEVIGDRFNFRVFPVEPGETKPVEIRSIAPLEITAGVIEYAIPLKNLPSGKTAFSLKVELSDDLPLTEIETIGFPGQVERRGENRAKVSFEGPAEKLHGPLKIRYKLDIADYALRMVSHKESGADGSFMLLVSPKNNAGAAQVLGRDIVFVLDRSGSMEGEPLKQTARAISYIVERLHPADSFDIVEFSDEPRSLFGKLVSVNAAVKAEAQKAMQLIQANGNTNINAALTCALTELSPARSGRPQAIVFLTDGQGDEPPEVVLSQLQQHQGRVRVFSFGAGEGVNRPFLDRLARDNRGMATFIEHKEDIETEITRLYSRIAMPLMVDLALEFDGLDVYSVYPSHLPDLYQDSQVIVLGRYRRPGTGTIRVKGQLKGQSRTLTLAVTFKEEEPAYAHVEKLWAKQRIDHLLDVMRARGTDHPEIIQEVTRLGIVYNLATPYTSFLAVPEKLKTAEIKELIRQGKRGYDQRLIDSMDSVRLSMQQIPPGDPVLTVAAPPDAQRVLAYFPFGLIKRLSWDPARQCWSARFLVPRNVKDGLYAIRIQISHADGKDEWKKIQYTIDSKAPEFDADVPIAVAAPNPIEIDVDPFEPVREVLASLDGYPTSRMVLRLDPETGHYRGSVAVPKVGVDHHVVLQISVRDLAHNIFERRFEIQVTP